MMPKFPQKTSLIIIGFVALILLVILKGGLSSKPSWQLSARNSPKGVIVWVFLSDQELPTYATILSGKTIPIEMTKLSREELPVKIGETLFYDETISPGRWTIRIAGEILNITSRSLRLKDQTITGS